MNFYKDYLQITRKRCLQNINIIICDDITPNLINYIKLLYSLKLKDGSLHEYYGDMKKIVNSFIIHWTIVLNDAIEEADKLSQISNKDDIIELLNKTESLQKKKQIYFERLYLPIESPEEQKVFDEISEEYNKCLEEIHNCQLTVSKLVDREAIDNYAKQHLKYSLRKKSNVFNFTHNYMAVMLASNLNNIRVSLEEIVNRARLNLRRLKEEKDEELNGLLNQLYDKNKEHLNVSRQFGRNSLEMAETQRSIDVLKCKIEKKKDGTLSRLKEEVDYWNHKLKEFYHIADTINLLNEKEKMLLQRQQTFLEKRDKATAVTKVKCWERREEAFKTKFERLKEMKSEAAKALMTFFSVRGRNRIFYTDDIGQYYMDEYGHQVYFYDYGLKMCHVNCSGDFLEAPNNEAYYYDYNGRYILENGEKVYKIASCTSSYRLVDDLMLKDTKDCGHSEKANKFCRMDIKDHTNIEVLPDFKTVDLKGLLDQDTATYIWNSFGHILPEVLYDVASAQPKNPIHFLAHKLLLYKYKRTFSETQEKTEDSARYRASIFQRRKDEAMAARRAWKATQMKRQKPEACDDIETQTIYGVQIAREELTRFLNLFE